MTTVCRQCNADASPIRLERTQGEDGGVRVSITGLTILECVNGHKRFLTPDFPLKFIETLLKSDALPPAPLALEKGFFRKHRHCPECGQQLPAEPDSTATALAELAIADADALAAEVNVPLYRCPGCKQEITIPKPTLEHGIMQAVANAFRSADIPPG